MTTVRNEYIISPLPRIATATHIVEKDVILRFQDLMYGERRR